MWVVLLGGVGAEADGEASRLCLRQHVITAIRVFSCGCTDGSTPTPSLKRTAKTELGYNNSAWTHVGTMQQHSDGFNHSQPTKAHPQQQQQLAATRRRRWRVLLHLTGCCCCIKLCDKLCRHLLLPLRLLILLHCSLRVNPKVQLPAVNNGHGGVDSTRVTARPLHHHQGGEASLHGAKHHVLPIQVRRGREGDVELQHHVAKATAAAGEQVVRLLMRRQATVQALLYIHTRSSTSPTTASKPSAPTEPAAAPTCELLVLGPAFAIASTPRPACFNLKFSS